MKFVNLMVFAKINMSKISHLFHSDIFCSGLVLEKIPDIL